MQYTANTTCRLRDRRSEFQRKLTKAADWSGKPMTARAECATAAVAGTLMFALFLAIYLTA